MNVQFAVQNSDIYVLEVNPRASRTVPFIAKATGVPFTKIAAKIMAGKRLDDFEEINNGMHKIKDYYAVKEAVFPFARFSGVDVLLGPEMKSTGEVMGLDADFSLAFAKAQLGAGNVLPTEGCVFISVKDEDKQATLEIARAFEELKFSIISTSGTARFFNENGVAAESVNKVREGRPHIIDAIKDGRIDLVINTTEGAKSISDSFSIRRNALLHKIPYSTTIAGSRALVQAIKAMRESGGMSVKSLQEYFA